MQVLQERGKSEDKESRAVELCRKSRSKMGGYAVSSMNRKGKEKGWKDSGVKWRWV
jgi:hypothetical protein